MNVWERNLTHVERHNIAMTVWHRRHPDTHFDLLVALELARRWRRHVRFLIVLYGLWTLFWGSIAFHAARVDAPASPLPVACATLGLMAITACVVVRRRLRVYLRVNAAEI